jgi:cytochrome c-type biogenesis protein CcmH/NrfG
VPNVHFAYASLLIGVDPEKAASMLDEELRLQPQHLPSRILLGIEYLNRGEPERAIALGEDAVQLAPRNFTGHVVLGRALAESGRDLARGIRELEKAVKLEPTSPQVRIALASAYAKAGKSKEAAAERAEFQRLKKMLEEPGR